MPERTCLRSTRAAADARVFHAIRPADDRRESGRLMTGAAARATRMVAGIEATRFDVRVTDVSPRGVGLRAALPLQSGDIYHLQVGFSQSMYVRIIRCRDCPDGSYDIGALFHATEQLPIRRTIAA